MLKLPIRLEEAEHSPKTAVYDFTGKFIFETYEKEIARELCQRVNAERWIPCSERLPDQHGPDVLLHDNDGTIWIGENYQNIWFQSAEHERVEIKTGHVTHWRELPPKPQTP